MKRLILKVGDVFAVNVNETSKKYFQYIADDRTQLNCNVIRVFEEMYSVHDNIDLSKVVKGKVEFYAHVMIKWGIKMSLWDKVGNVNEVGHLEMYFRITSDYGRKAGEEPVRISHKWYIWKPNDPKFTFVGTLKGEHRNAHWGVVVDPLSIVDRIKTGRYNMVFPG